MTATNEVTATASTTLIRQVGPYKIETNGHRLLCNGKDTTWSKAPAGSGLAYLVDTGRKGANGKRDLVGLKAEHYQVHLAAVEAADAAAAAKPANRRAALVRAITQIKDAIYEDSYAAVSRMMRDGRGLPVADRSSDLRDAQAALAEFDLAHPEVVAADRARHRAEQDALIASALNA